jgi:hypothetical protein
MRLGFWEPAAHQFFVAARTACDRPSQMDDSQCFGPDVAQVGEEFRGPCLCCVLSIPCGLERVVFGSFGQNHVRILRFKFSVFLFLGKQNY